MSDFCESVSSGDRVRALRELRDLLAERIAESPTQYVAQLSKQLSDVMRELDALQPPKEASTVDDLASRRAARRAKAAGAESAGEPELGGAGSD